MDEWIVGWNDEWVYGWMDEGMDGWKDEWVNGWMVGWLAGWMNDGGMDANGIWMNKSNDWSINQSMIIQSAVCLLTDCLLDRSIDRLIEF